MITNLFSIFDPSTSFSISFNWIRILIFLFLLPFQFWFIPSRLIIRRIIFIKYINNEFKILINFSPSNIIIFIRLIIFIFSNNFFGLFPYIFTASSHIRFCFSLSLRLWLRIIIFRFTNYLNNLLTHLTPSGTPFALIPFIVIIESIRLLIRPLTLSIRLTANIIAGHLLLTLLGSSRIRLTSSSIFIIIIIQIILYILEISVSIIQAYVFSILTLLYRREI